MRSYAANVVWTILTVVLVVGALAVLAGLMPGSMGGRAGLGFFRRPPGLDEREKASDSRGAADGRKT